MHLAVKSVDLLQSTRPVRFLLMKGADVDVTDNKGRIPLEFVKEVRSNDLRNDLTRMLVIIDCIKYLEKKTRI